MKVGLLLNVNNHTVDPATLARAVEEAGFESLWVGDHPVIPVHGVSPMMGSGGDIPEAYAHVSDPFVSLALMAGVTTRLKLGTGICILPARHPILTALQAATLDWFSTGRLLFGVGCGWLREELELLGADYARRLEQTREYAAAIRALWSDPERSFEGRWVSFPQVKLNPRPFQPGGPKILLGTWGPKAVERVAAWADGWLPMLVTPEQLAGEMDRLRVECDRRGRDADQIEVTLFEYDPGGDRASSQAFLSRYAEAGADRVVVIQGLGDRMGSHEWATWAEDRFRERLDDVASRYLGSRAGEVTPFRA
jgi:probable F420-dependent oxidoreductase